MGVGKVVGSGKGRDCPPGRCIGRASGAKSHAHKEAIPECGRSCRAKVCARSNVTCAGSKGSRGGQKTESIFKWIGRRKGRRKGSERGG